ncbi:hypothetical protein CCMSSC00406_0006775 [Pleurotus cornucopiae]|uniref:Uncharacterized protein n=1 Tax=Pleurotus cornucopiae TaxID=5321 RepID=A0ACB7J0M6_PLECO|nr:hypothetical protein CCMSSC00406_0006775 [Pleurotus cornucopiae]
MFASLRLSAVLFFTFISQAGAQGSLTNVTVDDASPRVQYLNGWSPGPSLYIQLDTSKLFNGTWHDTTHYTQDISTKEMHVNFTGVAVYVYAAIANQPSEKPFDAFADYKFLLDDVVVGEYRHEVEDTTDFFYNVPIYVNTTLPDKEHRFSVLIDSTEKPVLMLFDYLVYTTTHPPTTSELPALPTNPPASPLPASSQANASPPSESPCSKCSASGDNHKKASTDGAIIGGTVACIAVAIMAIMAILLLRRRRRRRRASVVVEPWLPSTKSMATQSSLNPTILRSTKSMVLSPSPSSRESFTQAPYAAPGEVTPQQTTTSTLNDGLGQVMSSLDEVRRQQREIRSLLGPPEYIA